MKLATAIVHNEDALDLVDALLEVGGATVFVLPVERVERL